MTFRLPDLMAAHPGGPVSLADATIIAILRVIQLGWRAAADVAERDAVVLTQELPMTNRLRAGMRRVVDSSEDLCPMRITPGTEVIPSEDGPAVGLTDISIYLGRLEGHDPHAIIECKRVHGGDSDLCRLYVTQGICRFGSGKYGADHAQDFMVGFVVQGDAGGAVAGINRYLNGRKRHVDQLTASDVLAESWVRQSCHTRPRLTQTTLHHAFLLVPRASGTAAIHHDGDSMERCVAGTASPPTSSARCQSHSARSPQSPRGLPVRVDSYRTVTLDFFSHDLTQKRRRTNHAEAHSTPRLP